MNKSVLDTRHMLIEGFENYCMEMAEAFAQYMGYAWRDMYAIGDDVSGTWGCGNEYYSLSTMYEVLKHQYDPDLVSKHYDYEVMYSGEDHEYGINLRTFVKLYDGSDLEEWAKMHHRKTDENRAYWSSPEGKKEERETFKKAAKKHGFEL